MTAAEILRLSCIFTRNNSQGKLIELHYALVRFSVRRYNAKPQNSSNNTMHQLASEAEIFHSHPSCLNGRNAIGITTVAAEGTHRYTQIHTHTRPLTDMLNIAYILCIVSMWQIIMALIFLCKYMHSALLAVSRHP